MNIANLVSLLKKPKASPAPLHKAHDEIDIAALEAEVARLEAERRQLLLTDDDRQLDEIDKRIQHARLAVERGIALKAELAAKIESLEAQRSEQQRLADYEAAVAAADRAAAELHRYPDLATRIVEILHAVAEADLAIAAANASLPAGKPPIPHVETAVRALAPLPKEKLDEVLDDARWHFADNGGLVPERLIDRITAIEGAAGLVFDGSVRRRVELRRRRTTRILEAGGGYQPQPLHSELNLPPLLPGQAPFWSPLAGLWKAAPGHDAADVLNVTNELRQAPAKTEAEVREPRGVSTKVEYIAAEPSLLAKLGNALTGNLSDPVQADDAA